jgi:hypothetical protein
MIASLESKYCQGLGSKDGSGGGRKKKKATEALPAKKSKKERKAVKSGP